MHDRAACRKRPDGAFEVSGIVSDVTERRRLEDELKRSMAEAELRASTDELTATFNRRRFAEIATESIASETGGCALLLLDADHFKQINDAYGHAVGDAVLVGLAERLSRGLRPEDCLARWGGEEFAVLLRGVEIRERAHRVRRAPPPGGRGRPDRARRSPRGPHDLDRLCAGLGRLPDARRAA